MGDDGPRASESSDALLAKLVTLGQALGALEESVHTRELRAKTSSYQSIVKGWTAVPPSDAQRDALRDLVAELDAKVAEARAQRRHLSGKVVRKTE